MVTRRPSSKTVHNDSASGRAGEGEGRAPVHLAVGPEDGRVPGRGAAHGHRHASAAVHRACYNYRHTQESTCRISRLDFKSIFNVRLLRCGYHFEFMNLCSSCFEKINIAGRMPSSRDAILFCARATSPASPGITLSCVLGTLQTTSSRLHHLTWFPWKPTTCRRVSFLS